MVRFAILFLIIISAACSSKKTCNDWAITTCSYGKLVSNEPGDIIESVELMVVFPKFDRDAPKRASCDKQYPDTFPLADTIRCKHYHVDLGETDTEPKIEDVNGNRIYSCISNDGTALVSYAHGSAKATFNLSGEVYEQDCKNTIEVDEY